MQTKTVTIGRERDRRAGTLRRVITVDGFRRLTCGFGELLAKVEGQGRRATAPAATGAARSIPAAGWAQVRWVGRTGLSGLSNGTRAVVRFGRVSIRSISSIP
ncbi:MAG: hypothetical protein JSR59_14135 [Proteobacteria bacterium]|nr:hypothetical protein [Pseudomonadota bacterium]